MMLNKKIINTLSTTHFTTRGGHYIVFSLSSTIDCKNKWSRMHKCFPHFSNPFYVTLLIKNIMACVKLKSRATATLKSPSQHLIDASSCAPPHTHTRHSSVCLVHMCVFVHVSQLGHVSSIGTQSRAWEQPCRQNTDNITNGLINAQV